jgi:hypothetical protein
MWKKPENPTACGGGEWLSDVWRSALSERAFSLEELIIIEAEMAYLKILISWKIERGN